QKRAGMSDNGTRFILRFTSFPEGARLFSPNLIAGSSALQATRAGDFGGPVSAGQYAASAQGTLVLGRVMGSAAAGSGGSPLTGSDFGTVGEIALANGSGSVVYEVLDSNPAISESAQIPVFLGFVPTRDGRVITTGREVQFAPISNSPLASPDAPIPRFAGGPAPTDCNLQGDCSGAYLPRLVVDPPAILFNPVAGIGYQLRYVSVDNAGGGALLWSAKVDYKSGSNWIRLNNTSGVGGGVIPVEVLAQNLPAPGTYQATLTVDAGVQAGVVTIPITVNVAAAPLPPRPAVSITSVTNAATFAAGPLVRGSLGTLRGANLAGENLSLKFDGSPARILYSSPAQINFQVPVEVANRTSSQVVVSVNGIASAPMTVTLAEASPGIFNPGILNQDNTVDSATNPAQVGSVVQLFATGLLPPEGGKVEVKLHDRILTPLYAAVVPGIPGLQQVNVLVPGDLPTMTTEVLVCNITGAQRLCSPPVKISLRQ
ncbi:MAG TPA: IPT/TIG domain-containing protein, partial [Bryobacteraceae bacterium]|nr:IPT/TIG domain-containing protein [Bryobacteraceae bacterium]